MMDHFEVIPTRRRGWLLVEWWHDMLGRPHHTAIKTLPNYRPLLRSMMQ